MRADVVLAGVGGQGVLTVARLLAEAAAAEGLCVTQGELHGMSQRGGAVQAQLRFSDRPIESPQVLPGRVDFVVGFEPLEALRSASWLSPQGRLVTAVRPIENMPGYPAIDEVLAALRQRPQTVLLDAHAMARAAGSARSENFVVAGAAWALLGLPAERLHAAVARRAQRWSAADRDAAMAALLAGAAAVPAAAGV